MNKSDSSFEFSPLEQAAVQLHEIYLSLMRGGFSSDEALNLIVKSSTAKSKKSDPGIVSPEFNVLYENPNHLSLNTQIEYARYYGYTDIHGTFDEEILLRYRYPFDLHNQDNPRQIRRSYYDKRETFVEEIWTVSTFEWTPTTRLTEQLYKGESTLSALSFLEANTIYPEAFNQ
jgi:hypothetical protein